MRHLRTTFDIGDRATLQRLLGRAQELKRQRTERRLAPTLSGRVIGMLLEKPSTRTRVSFEAGAALLGATTIALQGRDTQLATQVEGGEPLRDFARVLGGYVDALVVRPGTGHALVDEVARHTGVPVVNGLSSVDHPCQVVTDLFTVFERRERPFDVRWTFIGDNTAMANGLIALSAVAGIAVTIAAPTEAGLDPGVRARARAANARVSVTNDPRAAVEGADIISTAAWSGAAPADVVQRFQVNDALLSLAADGHTVLHPLPAHRGHEITDDVIEGMHSVVFQAANNRLPVQQAILEWLLAA